MIENRHANLACPGPAQVKEDHDVLAHLPRQVPRAKKEDESWEGPKGVPSKQLRAYD
jgi:hypothetical protein